MNFLLPLLSFFMGSAKNLFKEPGVALTQQLVLHLRALTTILVSAIGSLVLSCVGISLFISSLATQLDKGDDFHFTAGMYVYLILSILAVGVLIYSLKKTTWLKSLGFEDKPTQTKKSGALENAVALLVMDFVEERQSRRHKSSDTQAS